MRQGVDTKISRDVSWSTLKEVPHRWEKPRHRYYAVAPSLGRSGAWIVHNNSGVNCRRAVNERVFAVETNGRLAPPPAAAPGVFRNLKKFGDMVAKEVGWTLPWTIGEFAESYTGARRTRYLAAVQSLSQRPFTKRDAYLSSFVKAEGVLLTPNKPDPAPRVIQPRSPRYNVLVGRFLKPIEHKVYDAIARVWGTEAVVMKGHNARQTARLLRAKWDRYTNPCGVGLDASRFDQHLGPPALKWEHSVYGRIYRDNPELMGLLALQLKNVGFIRATDAAYRYEVAGCRMSGDMNTALGNCLVMCALVHRFAEERGLRCDLGNNGDDCMLICDRSDLHKLKGLQEWFLKYGLNMKQEAPVFEFEQVEFCQTQPVFADGGYIMSRIPSKALSKDVLLKGVDPGLDTRAYRKWLGDVGSCGLALGKGVPVFQAFYEGLRRHASGETGCHRGALGESGFYHMVKGLRAGTAEITPASRYSFWLAYGILPEQQESLEAHFSSNVVDLSRRVDQTLTLLPSLVSYLT